MIKSNKKEDLNISLRKRKIAAYILKQLNDVDFRLETSKTFVSEGRDAKIENIVGELQFDSDEALVDWIVRQDEVVDISFYFFVLKQSISLELCITPLVLRICRGAGNKNIYALAILELFTCLHSEVSPLFDNKELISVLLEGKGKSQEELFFRARILIALLRFAGFDSAFSREIDKKVGLVDLFVSKLLGSKAKSIVEVGIEGISFLFESSYFSEAIIQAVDCVLSRNKVDRLFYQVFDGIPKDKKQFAFTYLLEKYRDNCIFQGLDSNQLKLPAVKLLRELSTLSLSQISCLNIEKMLNILLITVNKAVLEPKSEENNKFLVDLIVCVGNLVEEVRNYELHCKIAETLLSYVELSSSEKVVQETVWCVEMLLSDIFHSAEREKLNERLLNCKIAEVLVNQLHSEDEPTLLSALNGLACLVKGSEKRSADRVLAILEPDTIEKLTLRANEMVAEVAAALLEDIEVN